MEDNIEVKKSFTDGIIEKEDDKELNNKVNGIIDKTNEIKKNNKIDETIRYNKKSSKVKNNKKWVKRVNIYYPFDYENFRRFFEIVPEQWSKKIIPFTFNDLDYITDRKKKEKYIDDEDEFHVLLMPFYRIITLSSIKNLSKNYKQKLKQFFENLKFVIMNFLIPNKFMLLDIVPRNIFLIDGNFYFFDFDNCLFPEHETYEKTYNMFENINKSCSHLINKYYIDNSLIMDGKFRFKENVHTTETLERFIFRVTKPKLLKEIKTYIFGKNKKLTFIKTDEEYVKKTYDYFFKMFDVFYDSNKYIYSFINHCYIIDDNRRYEPLKKGMDNNYVTTVYNYEPFDKIFEYEDRTHKMSCLRKSFKWCPLTANEKEYKIYQKFCFYTKNRDFIKDLKRYKYILYGIVDSQFDNCYKPLPSKLHSIFDDRELNKEQEEKYSELSLILYGTKNIKKKVIDKIEFIRNLELFIEKQTLEKKFIEENFNVLYGEVNLFHIGDLLISYSEFYTIFEEDQTELLIFKLAYCFIICLFTLKHFRSYEKILEQIHTTKFKYLEFVERLTNHLIAFINRYKNTVILRNKTCNINQIPYFNSFSNKTEKITYI